MNAERFAQLIDAYGARRERWPTDEREAAERFVAGSPEVAARLERASALDEALDAWAQGPETVALRERIVAGAPKPRDRWRVFAARPLWLAGAGLAAACAMGMVVGANLADLGLLAAPSSDPIAAVLTSSDSLTVFGAPMDLGKIS